MAESFKHLLTDASLNLNTESILCDGDRLTPDCDWPWSIRKYRLRGGRQEGVDIVEIDNGAMTIRVCPTRGMSILDIRLGRWRLGWSSPVEEVVHPMFMDPHGRGGLGWLEGFNEYLVRCGLEWFGPPGTDMHHHAAGEAPASNLTLHGKIAHIPASRLEMEIEMAPPWRLKLRGLVRQRMLFGPKLDLDTELVTAVGSSELTITDRITNGAGGAAEFGLLYHINHGPPLLEAGSALLVPARTVTAMTQRAMEGGIDRYGHFGPPKHGYTEQNYMLDVLADRAGQTRATLVNRSRSRGVTIGWNRRQLPCFTLWKNTQDERDGYVTGLEPGTNYPYPRPAERAAGRVPVLAAGDTFTARLSIALHEGKAPVAAAARQVTALQGQRQTVYRPYVA